jgi:methylmalonyl-CoA mutase C-terminal domain/subunit
MDVTSDPVAQPEAFPPRPIRMLIAKPGLDGHDRGARVLARAMRDAGFEVIYTGLFQTPEMIATAAQQEDVDVVGLSILSGAHMALFPRIMAELNSRGLDDVLVIAGGTIPEEDIDAIRAFGIAAVFGPGTSLRTISEFIRTNAPVRRDDL